MKQRYLVRALGALTTIVALSVPVVMNAPGASATAEPATGDFTALEATARTQGHVRVIVELNNATTRNAIDKQQSRVAAAVAGSATVTHRLATIPAMVIDATPATIATLRTSSAVKRVALDHANTVKLDISTGAIQAPTLWGQGVTGLGTNVAIIDTGVDTTHPMLSGKVIAEACFTVNACPNGTSSQTGTGSATPIHPHGTHVATTAAGRAWVAPNGMNLRGVAPDAGILAVQVFQNVNGSVLAYDSSMLSAIDWVVKQRATTSIASLNISIGGGLYATQADCDKARPGFASAFLNARTAGIAPVVAAGNDGATGSMSGPGCASNAISVAAVSNDTLNEIPGYSNIASWTSLFAPGGCGATTGRAVFAGVPGAQVAGYCGTSMAAPHVAGSFALLRQKQPTATIDTTLKALQTSGATVTSTRNTTGVRAIRVANALTALSSTSTTTTTAPPTTTTTKPKPIRRSALRSGYRIVGNDGSVFPFGDPTTVAIVGGSSVPVVSGTPGGTTNGMWLTSATGLVRALGDAPFLGDLRAIPLNQPIVGIATTPTGNGYWLVASDGGIFTFGDAKFYGSTGSLVLNQPIVGMTSTPTGNGYWLVARDGGIFTFGDAPFLGSTGGRPSPTSIVTMA